MKEKGDQSVEKTVGTGILDVMDRNGKQLVCDCGCTYKGLRLDTEDTGSLDAGGKRDIYLNYTQLFQYGIFPQQANYVLTFKVKTCNDAFILLSNERDLNSYYYYELVIGCAGGTSILLRRNDYDAVVTVTHADCASCVVCNDYRRFTVSWFRNGTITVQKDSVIYMDWTDPDPFSINGLGIRSGFDTSGSWIFGEEDCSEGFYGDYCQHICGHCKLSTTCDTFNGSCLHGCSDGWDGDKCDKGKNCTCGCDNKKGVNNWSNFQNYSRNELEIILSPKLKKIKKELSVNKSTLSFGIRRRTSAPDDRKSSKQIGIVGIVFLVMVIGLIVFIDITTFRQKRARINS